MAIDWNASLTAAGITTQEQADAAAKLMAATARKLQLGYEITALDAKSAADQQATIAQRQALQAQMDAIDDELTPHS